MTCCAQRGGEAEYTSQLQIWSHIVSISIGKNRVFCLPGIFGHVSRNVRFSDVRAAPVKCRYPRRERGGECHGLDPWILTVFATTDGPPTNVTSVARNVKDHGSSPWHHRNFLFFCDAGVQSSEGRGSKEESASEDALARRAPLRNARWWRIRQWMREMPSVATG